MLCLCSLNPEHSEKSLEIIGAHPLSTSVTRLAGCETPPLTVPLKLVPFLSLFARLILYINTLSS